MAELSKHKALKATTIVEVLVAITIVSICITGFFICFGLVNNNTKSIKMLKAMEVVEEMRNAAEKEGDLSDEESDIGELRISKQVNDTESENLKLLHFEISQDSVLIEEMNYLIVSQP